MSKIVWNEIGTRLFETGVDKGVLFIDGVGVPWSGLISIQETPLGGTITERHLDGMKYLDEVSRQEFAARIEAYTYPEEFDQCEGIVGIDHGLFVTNQSKKSFNLAYRSLVGNDLEGTDFAYKIHLIYNAKVEPSNRNNQSIQATVDPGNFVWNLRAVAPRLSGHEPTAHYVIDSRTTPSDLLIDIQNILYGTETTDPRLPSVQELVYLFEFYQASIFDAETIGVPYFNTFDSGELSEPQTSTIDGGSP